MKINGINGGLGNLQKLDQINKKQSDGFGEMLTEFVKDVNKDQLSSKDMTANFVKGEDVEIHDVMIAGQKAKTSLDLLMQIRNKTVDMYKELTRMQ